MIRQFSWRFLSGIALLGSGIAVAWQPVQVLSSPILIESDASRDRYFDVDTSTDGLVAYTVAWPGAFIARVKKSTNGGLSWTELSSSERGKWEAVSTSGDGEIVAVTGWIDGTSTGNALYVSTDAGATWMRRGTNTEPYDDVAVSADGNTIVVARPSGVATSTDDGVTWTASTRSADDVAVSANGRIIVASEVLGRVWRSVDAGNSWTELVGATPTALWQDIAISDDGATVFAVARDDQGYIWKGLDTPTRYATGSLGFVSPQAVRGAISPDGNSFIAGSYGALPRVLRSWDGSTNPATLTWQSQSTANSVLGLSITNRGERFVVVTESGGIWAYVPTAPAPLITESRRSDSCGSTPFGPVGGGTEIRIFGRYLFDSTVTVGGVAATVVGTTPGERIDVAVPAGVVGTAPIVVTTPSGAATATGGFTYLAPPAGWTRVGSNIVGESGVYSGKGVVSSADGSTVAVSSEFGQVGSMNPGFVRVYVQSGSSWVQRGGDITGIEDDESFGFSLAMSADGDTVVVGAPGFDDGTGAALGQVRIFRWSDGAWRQIGGSIEGATDGEYFGTAVASSADGETVIVGVPEANLVRVYQLLGTSWAQVGVDVPGNPGDYFGAAVAMSADGNTFAAAAVYADAVRLFRFDGTSWAQLGIDIEGDSDAGDFGTSLAMSADGETVVIGDPYSSLPGSGSGTVQVFDLDGSMWDERPGTVRGNEGENLGAAVDISEDGSVVAYSTPGACRYEFKGEIVVRVWDGTGWSQRGDFVPTPVPNSNSFNSEFGRTLALSGSGDTVITSDPSLNSNSGASFVWRYGSATTSAASVAPVAVDAPTPAVSAPLITPMTKLPSTGVDGPWRLAFVLMMFGGAILMVSPRRRNAKREWRIGVDEGSRTPDLQDHNLAL